MKRERRSTRARRLDDWVIEGVRGKGEGEKEKQQEKRDIGKV